ncbi:hypothetical protein CEXT_617091 [Caerostris extrusa]|uniref:Uncharacterized protein n=1 Tax=Caerostris extrusa TaxID=172846 RepID=A0AAV4XQ93_CAEEX|nr:hypothetical protein CEXT_617091 [Caerostris extrusa]
MQNPPIFTKYHILKRGAKSDQQFVFNMGKIRHVRINGHRSCCETFELAKCRKSISSSSKFWLRRGHACVWQRSKRVITSSPEPSHRTACTNPIVYEGN